MLQGRSVSYVVGEKCHRLTSEDGVTVAIYPEKALFLS